MYGFGGLERWNGMVEWTGLEWNGMTGSSFRGRGQTFSSYAIAGVQALRKHAEVSTVQVAHIALETHTT